MTEPDVTKPDATRSAMSPADVERLNKELQRALMGSREQLEAVAKAMGQGSPA